MRYTSPAAAAPNIVELLDLLKELAGEDGGKVFVYRGQVREYDSPLIPSLYRFHADLRLEPAGVNVPVGYGPTAIPLYFPYRWRELAGFIMKRALARRELKARMTQSEEFMLACSLPDPDQASVDDFLVASGVFEGDSLTAAFGDYEKIDSLGITDTLRRHLLRRLAAQLPYGHPISDLLCQQYGLTSGFLDASASLDVAAFFATHDSPCYLLPSSSSEIGVIYRFDATRHMTLRANDSPPAYILAKSLVQAFEDPAVNLRDVRDQLDSYWNAMLAGEKVQLKVPVGAFNASRLGRQESVMLAPLLFNDRADTNRLVGVEDLRSRPDCVAFYFHHGPDDWHATKINRNWLWPMAGDVYKWWLSHPVAHKELIKHEGDGEWLRLSKRLDLVSHGYDFAEEVVPNVECVKPLSLRSHGERSLLGQPIEIVAERLNNVLQALYEVMTRPTVMRATFGGQQMSIGDHETFAAFAVEGLRNSEWEFLFDVRNSEAPEHQPMKPHAQYAIGVILFLMNDLLRKPLPDLKNELSLLFGSVTLSDYFGDIDGTISCYTSVINLCLRSIFSSRPNLVACRAHWLLRCADSIDEILVAQSAHRVQNPNIEESLVALRKLKELVVAAFRPRRLGDGRWKMISLSI